MSTHEDLAREHHPQAGSDRSFGMVFCMVFVALGLWPLTAHQPLRLWALIVAGLFLTATVLRPRTLAPLNRLWFQVGLLLGRITTPLVMGAMFLFAVTPTALMMRLAGKRPLTLRFDPDAASYWIPRTPPGPSGDSLKKQF